MQFQELMNDLGVRAVGEGHEHCREGWVQIDCPFCHGPRDHFRLGFNVRGGYANCWSCGPHSLPEIIREVSGKSWAASKELSNAVPRSRIVMTDMKRGRLELPKGLGKLGDVHKKYLRSRGFDPKQMKKLWDLGGIGISSGTLSWRVFIPVFSYGRMVSWTTRTVYENTLRYLSASSEQEEVPHKSILYGEDYCRHAVVAVEGPTDVWRLGPGAVATFGTSIKQSQVLALSRYPVRAVCFDNEPSAQAKARQLVDDLSVFEGTTHNIVLDEGDPGSASSKDIKRIQKLFL